MAKKVILIVEDQPDLADLAKLFIDTAFSPEEYEVVVLDSLAATEEYLEVIENYSKIALAFLDGQLEGEKLSYPIAAELRYPRKSWKSGFAGLIFLMTGKDFNEVVPLKSRGLYNGFYKKPLDWRSITVELIGKWLAPDKVKE